MKKKLILILSALSVLFSFVFVSCDNSNSSDGNLFWLTENPVTAHALGGISDENGKLYTYTNSLEAFVKSYKAGIRCFECDVDYTSDKIPVLCHDWTSFSSMISQNVAGGGMVYSDFKKCLIYDAFHTLSLQDAIIAMDKFSDVYFDIDFGGKDPSIAVKLIKENIEKSKGLRERFIIEIYSFDDYKKIDDIYHFQNYLFTESLYNGGKALTDSQREEIIKFCIDKNIKVVAVYSGFLTEEIVKLYADFGISVVAYGGMANLTENFGELKKIGCAGIQSDFVVPNDWNNYGK